MSEYRLDPNSANSPENKASKDSEQPPNPGRRKFLVDVGKLIGAGTIGVLLGRLTNGIPIPFIENEQHKQSPTPSGTPSASPMESALPSAGTPSPAVSESQKPLESPTQSTEQSLPPTTETFTLGEKSDLSLRKVGLSWAPDGHISYFTTQSGKRRYFISAGNSTSMIETDGQKSLKDSILNQEIIKDQIRQVYTPDSGVQYRQDYAGITSVLQLDDQSPDHLLATVHCEQRVNPDASDTFTATVGLAESFDGGLTWTDKGSLITGDDFIAPGEKPSGAGQPCAVVKDGYVYVMYIDWSAHGNHSDQLYLARTQVAAGGNLGEIEYYGNNGFSSDKQNLKSVIPVPDIEGSSYAALPSLSFNESLNKYLCVFETGVGFCETTSDDLLTWSTPKIIFEYSQNNGEPRSNNLKKGEEYLTYPTYLSEDKPNDHTTNNHGEIYYASRLFASNSHNLKSVDATLS